MKHWNIKEQLWTIYNFNGPLLRVKFNAYTVAVLLKIFLKSSQIHVHYFDEEVSAIWSWIEEQPCRLESKIEGRKQETRGRKVLFAIDKCWENRSPHKKILHLDGKATELLNSPRKRKASCKLRWSCLRKRWSWHCKVCSKRRRYWRLEGIEREKLKVWLMNMATSAWCRFEGVTESELKIEEELQKMELRRIQELGIKWVWNNKRGEGRWQSQVYIYIYIYIWWLTLMQGQG